MAMANSIATPAVGRQAYAVAVTGHCALDARARRIAQRVVPVVLARLRRIHGDGLVALSGLAEGADTIFAEAALTLGLPLEACLASADIAENFAPGPQRERFARLVACSRTVHQLSFAERSNAAYMALGHWLVDSSDLLIAVWNGLPAAGLGGTGDVVDYARLRGHPTLHIHTREWRVTLLQG
jgi:hypothetical protein